jgi:hypothetical protein
MENSTEYKMQIICNYALRELLILKIINYTTLKLTSQCEDIWPSMPNSLSLILNKWLMNVFYRFTKDRKQSLCKCCFKSSEICIYYVIHTVLTLIDISTVNSTIC